MKDFLRWTMLGSIFLVPFVLLIVSGSMFFPYITGKNFAFRILVEIGFVSWALLALYDRDYRPRYSPIVVAGASMVAVMCIANFMGEYPLKSFWSNFERMEGWITLLHFYLYFIVLGNVLKSEEMWKYFLNTALVAGVGMTLFALGQIMGEYAVSQGAAWRVDARLGNSSYLGVYMLFQIFIAGWLFLKTKSTGLRYVYGALIFVFAYILLRTGTRGTTLGLIGGGVLAFSYAALMSAKGARIKKWALGALVALVLIVGGIWQLRDTEFVKGNPMLDRVANLTLAEGNIRFLVWQTALEGVKEKPILGWGQENFNYVFNKYYNPGLYGAETWYDRTHNIFLDWLIAGGVLGLLAYLAILASALWSAVIYPAYQRFKDSSAKTALNIEEQALILGLLAAYMFHNLFVFDNLGSWIFYAVVLALIHSRVAVPWARVQNFVVHQDSWERIIVPFGLLALAVCVYMVNVPGIWAARDIIASYRVENTEEVTPTFERALARESFGRQEIIEQMVQVGTQRLLGENIAEEVQTEYLYKTEDYLERMIDNKPGDARIHMVAAGFYRSTGALDKAMAELAKAEALAPNKQVVYEEQGILLLAQDRGSEAVAKFQKSYDLDNTNNYARVRLAAAKYFAGDRAGASEVLNFAELVPGSGLWHAAVTDEISFSLYYQSENYEAVEYMLNARKEIYPLDPQVRVNQAALYLDRGNVEQAIATLEEAVRDIPEFKAEGDRLINALRSGR